jgi:predicted nucleic acid-binding protein
VPAVAVVDTSVWVSAFLNPNGYPAQVYRAARAGRLRLLTSLPLLEELADVLSRPRIAKLLTGALALCRNPSDDIVLETAIVGNATHVVSRDEDLTRDPELTHHLESRGIQLVTVNRFLNELAGG